MKTRHQKPASRTRTAKPRRAAPVIHLASGPVTPAEAAGAARAAKSAFEGGLKLANLTKIAAVIEGKAMNGDLQAARMLMDYYGLTTSAPEADDHERPQQGNVVQVNIESEGGPRGVRLVQSPEKGTGS